MQRSSRETTAAASKRNGIRAKPMPRLTGRSVAVGNLSGPPQKGLKRPREPEFARNHSGSIEMQRNSRETTAGASKRNGIRAKPQRERRNQGPVPPTEFARNHSGSIETQRNSREATAGASKRNGIRAKPQRERRNQGPVPPPRAPLRSATNSFTLNVRTPLHCLGYLRKKKPEGLRKCAKGFALHLRALVLGSTACRLAGLSHLEGFKMFGP